jgi:DnaA family protein
MEKQLTLGFTLAGNANFDSYVAGGNVQAVADLAATAGSDGEQFIYLWGIEATGKTHLLQSACQRADAGGKGALYLPMAMAGEFDIRIFDGLEELSLVCLDDIQTIAGDSHWERALFHLFNRLRDSGTHLVVASDQSPSGLPVKLPDLASRLAWGLCYQLQQLTDDEKKQVLIEDAARRGLQMSEESAHYLLRHTPRNLGSLRRLLEDLDQASLEQQRRLTIPFIKSMLNRD